MTINLTVPNNNDTPELKPRITVIGVGGAGGNAVNNMIRSQLEGVDFVVANTDSQALQQSQTDCRIQLGVEITSGLGAGSRPEIGRGAAEESLAEVMDQISGSNMAFIAAGMGGGTGTGAAPVIAKAAREQGILTVGVVTKPFQFEGAHRARIAEEGIAEMEKYVDTLIIIPNQNLFRVANEKTTFADAFQMADDVLHSGVRGVTDLMVMPGLINLDFADVHSVMSDMGKAMMGTGEAEGERRALDAAEAAISNPLLDDTSMRGAQGVLISITGGPDMTLFEVDEAANRIRDEVDDDAYIIFGSTFDDTLEGKVRVSVVATGMDASAITRPEPHLLPVTDEAAPSPYARTIGTVSNPEAALEAATETILELPEEGTEEQASAEPEKSLIDAMFVDEGQEPALEEEESLETAEAEAAIDVPTLEPVIADAPAPAPDLGTPPPAMPSAGAMDAYIPPAPAQTGPKAEQKPADPFAAAAMANGARRAEVAEEPERKPNRGISLFERVTGTGRGAKGKPQMEATIEPFEPKATSPFEPKATSPMEVKATSPMEVKATSPMEVNAASPVESVAAPTPVAPTPMAKRPDFGGLEAEDKIPTSQPEEDLLDIPAFLRRQAN